MNESIMTKRMKEQFSFYAPLSALYAIFYAFCLYKNASGITYPFFVAGTFCYFFLSMKKLEVTYKKGSLFYMISIFLLAVSNCCTNSLPLLIMNKLGIFLLSFILILHTVYNDKLWTLPKYAGAIIRTIGSTLACIFYPFIDLSAFFDAQKLKKDGKKSNIPYIFIGFAVSIPLIAVILSLLCSADIVFNNFTRQLFSFNVTTIFEVCFLIIAVFFASYSLLSALCKKSVSEEIKNRRVLEPVIGITVTAMLSVVYLAFSLIQIFYLFLGNMQLPEGYTYSAYARQGFFQLLVVCILNLIIVLFCLSFFKENTALKIILTVICGCTFIMILSSALRMFMYIASYNLTFLRIFVLWALAVIFFLMLGVTIYIYNQKFPLFFYSMAVTTVFYIGLSFAHPDYWIANYNLHAADSAAMEDSETYRNMASTPNLNYLSKLSADAAPVLLDEKKNPYLQMDIKTMKKFVMLEEYYEDNSEIQSYEYEHFKDSFNAAMKDNKNFYSYYKKVYNTSSQMNIRNFNFSVFYAKVRFILKDNVLIKSSAPQP